jgi:hypothetical protein
MARRGPFRLDKAAVVRSSWEWRGKESRVLVRQSRVGEVWRESHVAARNGLAGMVSVRAWWIKPRWSASGGIVRWSLDSVRTGGRGKDNPKMATAQAEVNKVISLQRLQEGVVQVEIVGLTPYIPHKWSEKSKRMMPGHPENSGLKGKKGVRQPEEEAEACVYRFPDGRPGIPATSLKAAMVGACRLFDDMTMTAAKIVFHVEGEGPEQLIPFDGSAAMREDTPRNSGGTADLRYRYAFSDWKASVKVRYIKDQVTEESIVALIDAAGRLGIGDWRPSAPKSATGTFGTFRVSAD